MKLVVLLLTTACLQVGAAGYAQKITLKKKNASLENVFEAIYHQTGYQFVYSYDLMKEAKRVNIGVKNASLKKVLRTCFADQPFTYTIQGKAVILKKRHVSQIESPPPPIEVTGTVTDSLGNPLIGVTIKAGAGGTGTVTDENGNYSITVPDDAVLQVSYVGYRTQEVAVNGREEIDIVLKASVSELNQLVVVGYGTQKKIDLTGAVANISNEDIVKKNTTQLSQALQGSMPGVMVTRNSDRPGASSTIRLRGITTIGNSNPLIIVDGVKVDNIDVVNPNDVKEISVLKDAASASIYGSQAAAGVILITTKRAKLNEFDLEYNYETGFETPTETPDFVNVIRYMEMLNEVRWNDAGNGSDEYPIYGKNEIENYYKLHAENPDKYPNTNWRKLIFKKTAPRQSHFIRMSGGGERIKSTVSFAYDRVEGLYDKYSYKRLTIRANNDFTINNYLRAYVDASYNRAIKNQPYTNLNLMRIGRFSPPVYAATWKDGRYAQGKTGDNIYAQVESGGFKNDWDNHLGARVGIDFTPLEGLKLQAIVASRLNKFKEKQFRKTIPWYLADDPTTLGGFIQQPTTLWEKRNGNYNITSQLLGHYNKDIGKHSFRLLIGYEDYYSFHENLGASRDHYNLTEFPYLDVGPLELRDNSGSAYEYARRSFFGRIGYDFYGKYLLQANIRVDGSSRFAADNRWGTFPSISVGWVISKEQIMQNVSFIPFLKIRLSYGVLGNERIGNYPYQSTLAFNNALFIQDGKVVSKESAAQQKYAIRDISWETTESYNIGIDASFLHEKLNFSGNLYRKNTRDMLLPIQIPIFMGYDNPEQNAGDMYTKGWEVNLGYKDKIGPISFNVSFNLSNFKSIMGNLAGTEFLGDKIKVEGSEFNEWYGYRTDGLFQNEDELKQAALISNSTKAGDIHYVDVSGSEGTKDGRISPAYDRVLLGGSLPKYTYGGNITLNYKHFDFGITIQGIGKQNVRVDPLWVKPLLQNWLNMTTLLDGSYYSQYNSEEQNINAKYPRLTYSDPGSNYVMSDFWLFNGRYLRVKNISLGYELKESILAKLNIKSIRLYVNVSDLFSFDQYPKGYDPEGDIEDYPIMTNYIFGASIKF